MLAPFVNWYFRQRYEDIASESQKTSQNQQHLFDYLIEQGAKTVYGQQYGFKSIKNYADYKRLVPLVEYEDLKPWIEKIMLGEQQLLWPGDITWFAKSSGTTGNTAKFIPISYESLENTHFRGGRDILTIYCSWYPDTKLFSGKGLLLGGSHKVNQLNNNSFYGDLSAVLMNHLPFLANIFATPDINIALMENWDEKLDKMAQSTLNENVTSISGVPTWALVLFKRLLEITGKKNIHEVWPNLELFIHGGVNFAPYREQFKTFAGDGKLNFLETYNASEGFFGIQAEPSTRDMMLMSQNGIFYEFYPVNKGPEACVPLWETEPNVNYAMVISTNSGLWRYKIGDTVQFTSVNPYRFFITGRTKLFINAFGEELVIENAETAIAAACEVTNAVVTDYTAAPVYMDEENPGHEWLIEFLSPPENTDIFAAILDRELKNCNSDYEAKRKGSLAMKMPKITVLPVGTFQQWLKNQGRLGGQNKVPRLCNDRKIMEEILSMLNAKAAGVL
jgi:hypothetical protein